MGIGTLKCAVIDVEDLGIAEAFWSERGTEMGAIGTERKSQHGSSATPGAPD